MKSVKLKRLLIVEIILLMVMSVFTLMPFSLASGLNAFATDSEAESSDADGSGLRLVLTCDVEELETLESDQTFTLTARLEGVGSVKSGVYCVSVRITPLAAGDLEFVEFTPSRDGDKGVYTSELMKTSQHKAGKYVSMEASCNTVNAITEDFEVGSFKFKLKKDPLKPTSLKFGYKAMVTEFSLDFKSFPIEESTYELPIVGMSLGGLIGIAVGIVATIAIAVAVILIVDYKKKKGVKNAQRVAESGVGNDSAVDSVTDLQEASSAQEVAYSDNDASESDDNVAANDVYNDSAVDSVADLQEDSSTQAVAYSGSNASEPDDNVAETEFDNGNAVDFDLQEDNSKQN